MCFFELDAPGGETLDTFGGLLGLLVAAPGGELLETFEGLLGLLVAAPGGETLDTFGGLLGLLVAAPGGELLETFGGLLLSFRTSNKYSLSINFLICSLYDSLKESIPTILSPQT